MIIFPKHFYIWINLIDKTIKIGLKKTICHLILGSNREFVLFEAVIAKKNTKINLNVVCGYYHYVSV